MQRTEPSCSDWRTHWPISNWQLSHKSIWMWRNLDGSLRRHANSAVALDNKRERETKQWQATEGKHANPQQQLGRQENMQGLHQIAFYATNDLKLELSFSFALQEHFSHVGGHENCSHDMCRGMSGSQHVCWLLVLLRVVRAASCNCTATCPSRTTTSPKWEVQISKLLGADSFKAQHEATLDSRYPWIACITMAIQCLTSCIHNGYNVAVAFIGHCATHAHHKHYATFHSVRQDLFAYLSMAVVLLLPMLHFRL